MNLFNNNMLAFLLYEMLRNVKFCELVIWSITTKLDMFEASCNPEVTRNSTDLFTPMEVAYVPVSTRTFHYSTKCTQTFNEC